MHKLDMVKQGDGDFLYLGAYFVNVGLICFSKPLNS